MQSGMLWYDNSQKTILEKIIKLAQRYHEKFSVMPDTCYVHPDDAPAGTDSVDGIHIGAKPTIMPNHIWLGVARTPNPILAPTEPNGDDSHPSEPTPPAAPILALQNVTVADITALLSAAAAAAKALDRFVQLHDPRGSDVRALEQLNTALQRFQTPSELPATIRQLP